MQDITSIDLAAATGGFGIGFTPKTRAGLVAGTVASAATNFVKWALIGVPVAAGAYALDQPLHDHQQGAPR